DRPALSLADHPRFPRSPWHPGCLREAVGLRTLLRRPPPVLCCHWRRDATHPADRPHHPVPRRWRFVFVGKLDNRRSAADDLPHGPRPRGHHSAHGVAVHSGWPGRPKPPYRADTRKNPAQRTNRGGEATVNQAIQRSWLAAVAMFALIFSAISYVQVLGADDLNANPWNQRAILQNYCNNRGAI